MKNIFEEQVSVDGIENGIWAQPDFPTGELAGEPMVNKDGKPVRVRIRSKASEAFRDLERRRQRKTVSTAVKGRGKKTERELVNDSSKERDAEDFSVLVTGLENFDDKGVITPSPAELLEICADNRGTKAEPRWIVRPGMVWLVKWALGIADDDDNYPAALDEGKAQSET